MKLVDDLRFALRGLRKSPVFAAVAVATLAVAIGANVALWALVDAVLVAPLPYPAPDRLVALWDSAPEQGSLKSRVSGFNVAQWRQRSRTFESMAVYAYASATLLGQGEPVQISGSGVTAEFFPLLGVAPELGRSFAADDLRPDAPPVVLLSHALWSGRFAADPGVLGRPVRLDDTAYTVVGVLPRQLMPLTAWSGGRVEFASGSEHFWIPMTADLDNRHSHVLGVLGRLRAGVDLAAAGGELRQIAEALAAEFPDSNRGYSVVAVPLRDEAVGEVEASLWLLWGAVGLVLLIACANLGGLLLARADARRREVAIRAALGAGRRDRLRGFLAEGAILAAAGGAAGGLVASWALRLLPRISPGAVPRLDEAALDARALAAALACAALCTLVFTLVPGLSGRRDVEADLRQGERGGGPGAGRLRLRRWLVAAETAVAVVLVVGAGLLLRSFARLAAVDPGFRPGPTLAVELQHPGSRYGDMARLNGFYDRLFDELRGLPGVESVAAAYDPPLTSNWTQGFRIADAPEPAPGERTSALFRTVTPGYFAALGIELRRGRDFGDGDRADAPGVAIVNETFARRFFPDRDPLGRELRIRTTHWRWGDAIPDAFRIVGVVQDVKFAGLAAPSEPAFYLPYRQTPQDKMTVFVRTAGEPRQLLPAVRRTLQRIDPELPVAQVLTLDEILSAAVARPRFDSGLLAAFAASALLLAMLGVWGVLAAGVARRRREIGVRMALGAARRRVLALVLGDGLAPALAGTAAGLAGALAASRLLRGFLFEVSPTDPTTFAVVPLVLVAVAAAACLAPARAAARLDPMEILRDG